MVSPEKEIPKSLVVLKGLLSALERHMRSAVENAYSGAMDDYMLESIRAIVAKGKGVSPYDKVLDTDPSVIEHATKLGLPIAQLSPSAKHTGIVLRSVSKLTHKAYNIQAGRFEGATLSLRKVPESYRELLGTAVHGVESDLELNERGMKVIATIHELANRVQINALDKYLYEPGITMPMGGEMSIVMPEVLRAVHAGLSAEASQAMIQQHNYYENLAGMRMQIADVSRVHSFLTQR